jgi:hypothetical protein
MLSLRAPNTIAMQHKIIAARPNPFDFLALAVPTMLITKPTIAKGITPQFIHPRNGRKAINIPNILNKPKSNPRNCI